MSEYQYYEFRALDRRLTAGQQQRRLRSLSSRAAISATRFTNEYSFGDFLGELDEDLADEADPPVPAGLGAGIARRLPVTTVQLWAGHETRPLPASAGAGRSVAAAGPVSIWTGSGTLAAMKFTVADLVATLAAAPEESYVRVVADWLAHGEVAAAGPALTGQAVVDALVAAGTAHLARLNETEAPAWTQEPARMLPSFWHPGSDRFFAYSLAHAPAEFAARGILVEQDSLVSV